jgi:hypothetical protein
MNKKVVLIVSLVIISIAVYYFSKRFKANNLTSKEKGVLNSSNLGTGYLTPEEENIKKLREIEQKRYAAMMLEKGFVQVTGDKKGRPGAMTWDKSPIPLDPSTPKDPPGTPII